MQEFKRFLDIREKKKRKLPNVPRTRHNFPWDTYKKHGHPTRTGHVVDVKRKSGRGERGAAGRKGGGRQCAR